MDYQDYADMVLQELRAGVLSVKDRDLAAFVDLIIRSDRVFCDGKGRSGLQMDSFAMRLAQMGIVSYVVSETTTPSITDRDLLLICSGSGETPSLVEHARKASELGATIVLVTTAAESTIGKFCDYKIVVTAPNKKQGGIISIQPMGTLFEQTVGIFFDIVVLMIMSKKSISAEDMYLLHNNLE